MNKKHIKAATLLIVLIGIAVAVIKLDVSWIMEVDLERIQDIAQDNLFMILLITFGLSVLQNMLTVIPLILLISLNISLFGLMNGFLWSWLTSIIGASIAFVVYRFWLQDYIVKKLNPDWAQRLEANGFLFTFVARMFPFAPTSLINIAAGGSAVRFKSYLLGTMAGNLIFFFVMSLLSEGFMSADFEQILTTALCVCIVAGAYYWHRRRKNRRNRVE